MDYPIRIHTTSIELSTLYFKGLPVKISSKWCISVPEDGNSADPDEIPPYAAFHQTSLFAEEHVSHVQNQKLFKS